MLAGSARAGLSPGDSGDVRDGMVGQRDGGIGGPGRIAGRMIRLFGMRVPQAQVCEDFADDGGIVDDGDEAHGAAAFGAFQGY